MLRRMFNINMSPRMWVARRCELFLRNLTVFKAFVLIFIIVSLIWICLQLALYKTCLSYNNLIPAHTNLICRKRQSYLLLHLLDIAKTENDCRKVLKKVKDSLSLFEELPIIYIITPTYKRPVQKAELTRLSHTLTLVPNTHWIVVEDSVNKSSLVSRFLEKTHVHHTHLNVPTPDILKTNMNDPNWLKPRGVLQRNKGLSWIRDHLTLDDKGVLYFADDDNTYDLDLFQEMRYTKTVSVWPVGLVGGLMVERPLVKNGKVVGWNTLWKADRPFPIDMAGFAVNITLVLQHPKASFSVKVPRGYQESKFLKDLVKVEDLEPKAKNCTKVLVWHTRTEYPKLKQEKKLSIPSDAGIEV